MHRLELLFSFFKNEIKEQISAEYYALCSSGF